MVIPLSLTFRVLTVMFSGVRKLRNFTVMHIPKRYGQESRIFSFICSVKNTYTMQNKFSNFFVWVSPSTSDLTFHFLALG